MFVPINQRVAKVKGTESGEQKIERKVKGKGGDRLFIEGSGFTRKKVQYCIHVRIGEGRNERERERKKKARLPKADNWTR